MIISHKYKFIFIKTRKTAGSSISNVLRKYLGPTDIADGDWVDGLEPYNVTYEKNRMDGHQTCKWIAKSFPKEWDTYYKFTIERNPWEKVISGYNFYKQIDVKGLPDTITEFLTWEKKKWIPVDWGWYTVNSQVVVDQIIDYSNLHNDFKDLMEKLNVPYENELGQTRMKQYSDKKVYAYTEEDHKLIKSLFRNEIRHFGYSW